MNIILNFLGSPKVGDLGLRILRTFTTYALLALSMFFPAAGWHRIFLRLQGWYWWSVCGFLGTFGALTGFIFHQQTWLLMALPLAALFAHDSVLIFAEIWRRK